MMAVRREIAPLFLLSNTSPHNNTLLPHRADGESVRACMALPSVSMVVSFLVAFSLNLFFTNH